MNKLAKKIGYSLVHEWYINRYFVSLDWLARSTRELRIEIFDVSKVKNLNDKVRLIKYRVITESLAIAKKISATGKTPSRKFYARALKMIFRITLCPIADVLISWFDRKVEKELQDGGKRNGSAMFLVYSK